MENFFVDDRFYTDLDDYMIDNDIDEETIHDLPDDWSEVVFECKLEKIFVLDEKFITELILNSTEQFEDRFPEDSDDVDKQIKNAIRQSIDINKLNQLLPSLYYPTGSKSTIIKADLNP